MCFTTVSPNFAQDTGFSQVSADVVAYIDFKRHCQLSASAQASAREDPKIV